LKKIRVLVVEDSALMRRIIGDIINEHEELELVDTARDGLDALKKIESAHIDVVTLDLEMPRLDGLQTLRKIMAGNPLPVVMLSSHTKEGSESTLKALEAGAVDFIAKPAKSSIEDSFDELRSVLPQKIITAATARVSRIIEDVRDPVKVKVADKAAVYHGKQEIARLVIAIGASTGGPKALETVLSALPADLPAAVILSQHMPPGFTSSFSQRLDMMSALKIKEAEDGDRLLKGQVLVAPGGYHLLVTGGVVKLDSGPKVNFVRPSIDVMLDSMHSLDQKMMVVIMTGMGKDGATGAAALKAGKKGTVMIAQQPSSALIPSMPEALIKSVDCDSIVPLGKLAEEINRFARILA
jgi:two-component system, chemotaxis family, protein-glutamate methylesterase/glutaminase